MCAEVEAVDVAPRYVDAGFRLALWGEAPLERGCLA